MTDRRPRTDEPLLALSEFRLVGEGLSRPEDTAVRPDGTVWAAHRERGVARIEPGPLQPCGDMVGMPNGITFVPSGEAVVADFDGGLCWIDVDGGTVVDRLQEVEGRPLVKTNYVLADATGYIWATESTRWPTFGIADIAQIAAAKDGWVFVRRPDGSSEVVADGLCFANGATLSADGQWLYVAESFSASVRRARIGAGGSLGPLELVWTVEVPSLPPFPGRTAEGGGDVAADDVGPVLDGLGFDLDGNLWITIVNWATIVWVTPRGEQRLAAYDPSLAAARHAHQRDVGRAGSPPAVRGIRGAALIAVATVPVAGAPQPWEIHTPAVG